MRGGTGSVLGSAWVPATFDAASVLQIACLAAPCAQVLADPAAIADVMNNAAGEMLLSLKMNPGPAAAEAWATDLAQACRDVRLQARPTHRVASRIAIQLGVDMDKVTAALATLLEIETGAQAYAQMARAKKGPRPRPTAENRWLESMQMIYVACFGRRATTNRTKAPGEPRDGAFARFVAESATRLLLDTTITDTPDTWSAALTRFSAAKTVAGRMETIRARPLYEE